MRSRGEPLRDGQRGRDRPQGGLQGRGRGRVAGRGDAERARAGAGRRAAQGSRARCRSCSTSPREVVRAERGVLICRTHHGFVCANAGVDASNAADARHAGRCCPRDPDASARGSARALRERTGARAGGADQPTASGARGARPVRRGDRLRRPGRRWRTGAGAATAAGASCAPPGWRSPTRPPRRPTWRAPRTRASRSCSSRPRAPRRPSDGPGAAALLRPRRGGHVPLSGRVGPAVSGGARSAEPPAPATSSA